MKLIVKQNVGRFEVTMDLNVYNTFFDDVFECLLFKEIIPWFHH